MDAVCGVRFVSFFLSLNVSIGFFDLNSHTVFVSIFIVSLFVLLNEHILS